MKPSTDFFSIVQLHADYFNKSIDDASTKEAKAILDNTLGSTIYAAVPLRQYVDDMSAIAPKHMDVFQRIIDKYIDADAEEPTRTELVDGMFTARFMLRWVASAVIGSDSNHKRIALASMLSRFYACIEHCNKRRVAEIKRLEKKLSKAETKIAKLESRPVASTSDTTIAILQQRLKDAEDSSIKQQRELEHNLREEYDKVIKAQSAEIEALTRRLNAALSELATSGNSDEIEDELPEVPERGVIFVGGHQNMTYKLKALYPDWSFNPTSAVPSAKFVVIFYDYCGHTLSTFVDSNNRELKKIYVRGTNIQSILTQIQVGMREYGL